jgi:hypothetical protein
MNAPTPIPTPATPVPPYRHTPLFPLGPDTTPYKKITTDGVRVERVLGRDMLVVSREALRALSEAAFGDINHYLRPGHLKQLRSILDDAEASDNDKFVAFDFLKNANIAAGGVLPMCQDTGTAIIMGKKGCNVLSDGDDEAALSEGATLICGAICVIRRWRRCRCMRRKTPPTTCRRSARSMRRAMTPTSSCSWPRAGARPTRAFCSRRRRRCSQKIGCWRS